MVSARSDWLNLEASVSDVLQNGRTGLIDHVSNRDKIEVKK